MLQKLTNSAQGSKERATKKLRVNKLVTGSHICITLAFSISQTLTLFRNGLIQEVRMTTAFLFFGGAADLFLSVMLWFILDDGKKPLFFVDGERVHSVEDVIDIAR